MKAIKEKGLAFLTATLKECTGIAHAAIHGDLMAGALHEPEADEEGVIPEPPPPLESMYKHSALSVAQIKGLKYV